MAEGSQRPEDLSQTVLGGSEFCFDFYCQPCQEDDRHCEAVGYCKDCRDYLCDECYRSHCRPKQLRHHVLLERKHMPKDLTSSRRVVHTGRCTDACNKHPDKVIEYYCHIHDVIACSACAFADHRTCDEVDLIADVAGRTGENEELSDTQAKLQDLAKQAHQNIKTSQDNISLSNKCKNTAIKSVKTYIHETISSLQKFEKEIESEAKELDSKNERKLKAAFCRSDSVLAEIKGTLQSLSILEKNKQYCNLYVTVKKALKTLPTLTKELDRARQDSMVDEFKFEPNLKLQSMLHHKGGIGDIIAVQAHSGERINTLDRLIGVSDPDSKQTTTNISVITSEEHKNIDKGSHESSTTCSPDLGRRKGPRQSGANSSIQTDGKIAESAKSTPIPRKTSDKSKNSAVSISHMDLNARHITDIKVKRKSDSKKCKITGFEILPDGNILAADHTNSKVKVIDINKQKVISEFKLESEPWDVSSVDRNKIAITLPYVSKFQYLNVSADGTVSTGRFVNVNGNCFGIAFARDKLWVSYISPGKLEALTLDGDVLISISTDKSGQAIFSDPRYVAISPDMETIYVSDIINMAVIRLSSSGKYLSDCKLGYSPTGVAVAADGTVYTCGVGVDMLTAECEKIKKLLLDVGAMWSLAYDEDTRRLFIGIFSSDAIKIFRLTEF